MTDSDRRRFLQTCVLSASTIVCVPRRTHGQVIAPTIEQWMDAWMRPKAPVGTLHLSRFVEPVYFLTKSIAWRPNPGEEADLEPVHVPRGFVTDFASIPRVFWSALRPDGDYTYPAIVHDFLYWSQRRPRETSDRILRSAMKEFGIGAATITLVYETVRIGGQRAWDTNARLKARGERRILERFPDDPLTRWGDWKRLPDVFVAADVED